MGAIAKFIATFMVSGLVFYYTKSDKIPPVPEIGEKWWGPGSIQQEDTTIRPFKVQVSNEIITDLKWRLNNSLPLQPPLEGVDHEYGINTNLLNTIIDYWRNEYNWSKQQEFLNSFPQFETNIQGIRVHFLHVKPKNVPHGIEVIPLLILHGWPSSVREFYEMIPVLTKPHQGRDFVFEVIAPSLPGYGFSDAASKPGMGPAQIAQIFNKLMNRLKFNRYYLHGGDWGSVISHSLAVLYPENVIAVHRNWCFINVFQKWKTYIGSYFPNLFFTEKEAEMMYPLWDKFSYLVEETGYFHIQATKPDTFGVALRESPAGLAAYIIEKFITYTNPKFKHTPDGGITKKYTLDQLLDNVMIYWVTRSITTSMRLYSENFHTKNIASQMNKLPITIPAGCNRFRNEITFVPEVFLREAHTNLIHLTDYDDGGHFAALEVPNLLGNDIIDFVGKVKNL